MGGLASPCAACADADAERLPGGLLLQELSPLPAAQAPCTASSWLLLAPFMLAGRVRGGAARASSRAHADAAATHSPNAAAPAWHRKRKAHGPLHTHDAQHLACCHAPSPYSPCCLEGASYIVNPGRVSCNTAPAHTFPPSFRAPGPVGRHRSAHAGCPCHVLPQFARSHKCTHTHMVPPTTNDLRRRTLRGRRAHPTDLAAALPAGAPAAVATHFASPLPKGQASAVLQLRARPVGTPPPVTL